MEAQAQLNKKLFETQVQSVTDEVQISDSVRHAAEAFCTQIADILKSSPPKKVAVEKLITHATSFGLQVEEPFRFKPPVDVAASSVLSSRCCCAVSPVVPIYIHLPSAIFSPKDFINNVYFFKRTCYLSVVSRILTRKLGGNARVTMYAPPHDPRCQEVHVVPLLNDEIADMVFVIKPVLPASVFPLQKLSLWNNSLRTHNAQSVTSMFPIPVLSKPPPTPPTDPSTSTAHTPTVTPAPTAKRHKTNAGGAGQADVAWASTGAGVSGPVRYGLASNRPPGTDWCCTPWYNQAVLEDVARQYIDDWLFVPMACRETLVQAVLLIQVWARQHGLNNSTMGQQQPFIHDMCPLTLVPAILLHLLHKGAINGASSAWNAFVAFLVAMSQRIAPIHTPQSSIQNIFGTLGMSEAAAKLHDAPNMPHIDTTYTHKQTHQEKPELKVSDVFDVIVSDPSGAINLTRHMSTGSVLAVRDCARKCLSLINSNVGQAVMIHHLFISKQHLTSLYDAMYTLPLSNTHQNKHIHINSAQSNGHEPHHAPGTSPGKSTSVAGSVKRGKKGKRARSTEVEDDVTVSNGVAQHEQGALCDVVYDVPLFVMLTWQIRRLLRSSLADRLSVIRVLPLASASHISGLSLAIRFLSTSAAHRGVVNGPPANQARQTALFKAIWGPWSEVRRMADGAILNTASHSSTVGGGGGGVSVPDQFVTYVLNRHFQGGAEGPVKGGVCGHLSLSRHELDRGNGGEFGGLTPAQSVTWCRDTVRQLARLVRGLEDVPLRITAVTGFGDHVRGTSPHVLQPHPLLYTQQEEALTAGMEWVTPTVNDTSSNADVPRCVTPVHVAVELEGSGKWPRHATAFQKTKAALGAYLSEKLNQSGQCKSVSSEEYVDVVMNGLCCRMWLHSERELQWTDIFPPSPSKPTIQQHVQLHSVLSAVAGHHPITTVTSRLFKRWVAAQQLSPHISPQLCELLVAAAHSPCHATSAPPTSALSSFVRVLNVVSTFPFEDMPMVVELETRVTRQQYAAIEAAFEARKMRGAGESDSDDDDDVTELKKADVEGARPRGLFVAVVGQHGLDVFSFDASDVAVTRRLAVLAQRAMEQIQPVLMLSSPSAANTAFDDVFKPSIEEYDAVVLLHESAVPKCHQKHVATQQHALQQHYTPLVLTDHEHAAGYTSESSVILSGISAKMARQFGLKACGKRLLMGFDPRSILMEHIKEIVGNKGLVFCDGVDGVLVCIKWVVRVDGLDADGGWGGVDVKAVLREVSRVGEGMIQRIFVAKGG